MQLVSGTTGNGEKRRDSPLSRFLPGVKFHAYYLYPKQELLFLFLEVWSTKS